MNTKRIISKIKAKQNTMDRRVAILYSILLIMPMGFPVIILIETIVHIKKQKSWLKFIQHQKTSKKKIESNKRLKKLFS